jgi:hypothetical protein
LELALILAGALALRVPALRWGLPPATAPVVASDIRSSYAFDEDDLLSYVSFSKPWAFDFRLYHWGTLHFNLLLPWMEAAEKSGYIGAPWRAAYYNMVPGAFERVYVAARWLSLAGGLALLWAVYLLGCALRDRTTGVFAAALVAVSPAHLLASVQARVDLTMAALATLAVWLALGVRRDPRPWVSAAFGLVCGLAVTAKYPAAFIVLPVALVVLRRRAWIPAIGGFSAGVLIGQPYLLVRAPEMWNQIAEVMRVNTQVPQQFRIPLAEVLGTQVLNAARFLLGPVALGLALVGLRRAGAPLLAALGGAALTLIPLGWPLLRYELPLLPFLAVTAGLALTALPARWRVPVGAAALVFPLAASLAQIYYMRAPHPANRALEAILATVPPGTPISRLMPELPPLDRKVYPMGPNPLLEDLRRDPPAWVLTADLPFQPYPAATMELLAARYRQVEVFETPRILAWGSLGEAGAPHDWKYTHPRMVLYCRREP